MLNTKLKEQLSNMLIFLKQRDLHSAKELFTKLDIVDSPEHLALPSTIRHLIWALNELLILSNTDYTTVGELTNELEVILNY